MSLARRRALASLVALAVLFGAIGSFGASGAVAQQGKITQRDCSEGRIHDRSGKAIATSRCQGLIGKSVTLAPTGFNVWPVGLAGVACIAAAGALRRSARRALQTT